jgi:hypothetical protein
MEPLQRVIDLARRDGEAYLAQLEPHVAEILGGAQRLDGGKLHVVGGIALPRGQTIAELLLAEHAGHQQHAEAGPDGELRAN